MRRLIPYISLLLCIFLSGCHQEKKKIITAEDIRKYEERNIEINKEIVKLKQDTIKQYISDNNLEMDRTGSGLWYHIYHNCSDTMSIQKGDIVRIAYSVRLLNNKLCYSSDSTGFKEFKVGQGGVESGLEEAILLMHQGDSADLIIPPHLAHGLIGDQNKIPTLAILHYSVEIKYLFKAKK
ncbi:MAG: FKBP-type peptidyl-prolyl cis-trans isomerase [Bacteroidales bacterium]|nr:FKBP-type peptidyl-prolyl cis-trans isomerase [Bacteroidales bacterium]